MPLKRNSARRHEKEKTLGFVANAISYRVALPVTKMVRYPTHGHCFSICPRCKSSMEREYMSFCDRCGQKLNWDLIEYAEIIDAPILK